MERMTQHLSMQLHNQVLLGLSMSKEGLGDFGSVLVLFPSRTLRIIFRDQYIFLIFSLITTKLPNTLSARHHVEALNGYGGIQVESVVKSLVNTFDPVLLRFSTACF